MNKTIVHRPFLLVTYTILLISFLLNLREASAFVEKILDPFTPLFIGFSIAFVLHRPCTFFSSHFQRILPPRAQKAARPLAVLLSYLVLIGVIALLVSFVIPGFTSSIQTFVGSINVYTANLEELYDWVVSTLDLEIFERFDLSALFNALKTVITNAFNSITSAVPQLLTATAKLFSGIVTLFLSVVFSIYLLASWPILREQCRRLVLTYLPKKISSPLLHVTHLSSTIFTNFITGQVTEACILGILCFIGMTIFRFAYAPLVSVIIAVSALIPIAGAYLGAGLSFLLLVMINPMQGVWFLIFLLILQQLEGNIIYPRVVGTSIGLPGLWVLASVTVGGGLFGFLGMLLGVPVTAVLYTLLRDDVRARVKQSKDKLDSSTPNLF